jgi:predicted Zn-dependent protease
MAGQIHVDIGQLQKGAQAFESALKIKPELFLTRLHLAEAYLALDELDKSYDNFSVVRQEMPEWPSVWHGLGIVYGKKGYIGESHLALAEESLLKGEKADAKFHIKAASIYKDDMGEPAQKWLVEVQKALKEKDK